VIWYGPGTASSWGRTLGWKYTSCQSWICVQSRGTSRSAYAGARTPAQVSDCDRSPASERGCRLPPTSPAAGGHRI